MKRLIIAILFVISTLHFVNCERSDMYDLSANGLAPGKAMYIYSISASTGDLGGRDSADMRCYNEGLIYLEAIKASTVHAFIGFSFEDQLRSLVPTAFWLYPVVGVSSYLAFTTISENWAGLFDGMLTNPVNTAVGLAASDTWWSGSYSDGSQVAVNSCSGWQDSSSAYSGQTGSLGLYGATISCDTSSYLLCVAY